MNLRLKHDLADQLSVPTICDRQMNILAWVAKVLMRGGVRGPMQRRD
jgi:hypothetical protein